ncbi:putative nucleosome assembly protein 1-like 1 [Monocercomonoides exilis]|uniref:putative nucleosome assembly protein 1-like 1 n=1 Tax=Monocercomonoides exilis TaxID=2049356 RepID=UPI003559D28E|nr:putative nucleosome assembly protein 1-like 1 [Monocercomonoides exilis]
MSGVNKEDQKGVIPQEFNPFAQGTTSMSFSDILGEKLNSLMGKPTGLLDTYPSEVKRRLRALKKLQMQFDEERTKMENELKELEKRHVEQVKPILSKQSLIIKSEQEPKDDDLAEEFSFVEPVQVEMKRPEGIEKGVPNYWLNVLLRSGQFQMLITTQDREALKYLEGIEIAEQPPSPFGITEDASASSSERVVFVKFSFKENPFFTNKELVKKVQSIQHEVGAPEMKGDKTAIEWKEGHNLTQKSFDIITFEEEEEEEKEKEEKPKNSKKNKGKNEKQKKAEKKEKKEIERHTTKVFECRSFFDIFLSSKELTEKVGRLNNEKGKRVKALSKYCEGMMEKEKRTEGKAEKKEERKHKKEDDSEDDDDDDEDEEDDECGAKAKKEEKEMAYPFSMEDDDVNRMLCGSVIHLHDKIIPQSYLYFTGSISEKPYEDDDDDDDDEDMDFDSDNEDDDDDDEDGGRVDIPAEQVMKLLMMLQQQGKGGKGGKNLDFALEDDSDDESNHKLKKHNKKGKF